MTLAVVSAQYESGQSAKLPRPMVERYVLGIPCAPQAALIVGNGKPARIAKNGGGAVGAKLPLRFFHAFNADKSVETKFFGERRAPSFGIIGIQPPRYSAENAVLCGATA